MIFRLLLNVTIGYIDGQVKLGLLDNFRHAPRLSRRQYRVDSKEYRLCRIGKDGDIGII